MSRPEGHCGETHCQVVVIAVVQHTLKDDDDVLASCTSQGHAAAPELLTIWNHGCISCVLATRQSQEPDATQHHRVEPGALDT